MHHEAKLLSKTFALLPSLHTYTMDPPFPFDRIKQAWMTRFEGLQKSDAQQSHNDLEYQLTEWGHNNRTTITICIYLGYNISCKRASSFLVITWRGILDFKKAQISLHETKNEVEWMQSLFHLTNVHPDIIYTFHQTSDRHISQRCWM